MNGECCQLVNGGCYQLVMVVAAAANLLLLLLQPNLIGKAIVESATTGAIQNNQSRIQVNTSQIGDNASQIGDNASQIQSNAATCSSLDQRLGAVEALLPLLRGHTERLDRGCEELAEETAAGLRSADAKLERVTRLLMAETDKKLCASVREQ